jgi:hypothetical protein
MSELSPRDYEAILRSDLSYFAQRCFCELNPQAVFAINQPVHVATWIWLGSDRRP